MKDFAAIDFETANNCHSSVCSIGVVIVRNGEIVDSFYSLIHPEPEYYQWFCQQVHGISEEDTDNAPVFPYVWEKIAPKFEGLPLVRISQCKFYRLLCNRHLINLKQLYHLNRCKTTVRFCKLQANLLDQKSYKTLFHHKQGQPLSLLDYQ